MPLGTYGKRELDKDVDNIDNDEEDDDDERDDTIEDDTNEDGENNQNWDDKYNKKTKTM